MKKGRVMEEVMEERGREKLCWMKANTRAQNGRQVKKRRGAKCGEWTVPLLVLHVVVRVAVQAVAQPVRVVRAVRAAPIVFPWGRRGMWIV